MPFRHKVLFALAGIHLLLVALYAGHFAEWANSDHPFMKQVSTLAHYTGSNNIFSFFAPALSDQPYVVYAIKDSAGRENVLDLQGMSPDFTNRVNNIYGYMTLPEARPVFSASLAQFIFNRYPAASTVRVAMVVQKIPDMPSFRKGERCQWHFWFHKDFERNKHNAAWSTKTN